jgi:hypothetical protein
MARIEGAKRMMLAGKVTVWMGLGSMLLSVVITLIAIRIPPTANVPWMAINMTHILLRGLGVLALGIGAVLWMGGWVLAGFLA